MSTTSPNSKGIVGIVLGIVPDHGKDGGTRGNGRARERAMLFMPNLVKRNPVLERQLKLARAVLAEQASVLQGLAER